MRFLVLLCFAVLAACAPQEIDVDGLMSNDAMANELIGNGGVAMGNYSDFTIPFVAANFPPQCDPGKSFPDGKVPKDFLTNYQTPEYERFHQCIWADAKAHATGADVLIYMEEGKRPTECAAADQYPDGKVHPGFYAYPAPPEYDRYIACVVAEARRDGDRVPLASAKSFPKVGACYSTRITEIYLGTTMGRPSGPSYIDFDNDLQLWDYSYVRGARHSRAGDAVRVCVHDLPEDCPANDLRGIGYRARNLRTGESWIMGDTQHTCRGA